MRSVFRPRANSDDARRPCVLIGIACRRPFAAPVFTDSRVLSRDTEAIASARRDGQRLVVSIMGNGHIEYGDGVPHQLAALGIDDVATALP